MYIRDDCIHFGQFRWHLLAERPFNVPDVIQTKEMKHQQLPIILLQLIGQHSCDVPVTL